MTFVFKKILRDRKMCLMKGIHLGFVKSCIVFLPKYGMSLKVKSSFIEISKFCKIVVPIKPLNIA